MNNKEVTLVTDMYKENVRLKEKAELLCRELTDQPVWSCDKCPAKDVCDE